jgi:hypothetical protein
MYSLEQLEILMLVAGAEEPARTACQVRQRWGYIRNVALAARRGQVLDASLPQVLRDPDGYCRRAEAILAALDEWLAQQPESA